MASLSQEVDKHAFNVYQERRKAWFTAFTLACIRFGNDCAGHEKYEVARVINNLDQSERYFPADLRPSTLALRLLQDQRMMKCAADQRKVEILCEVLCTGF